MIMMSRNTTRTTSQGHNLAGNTQRDIDADEQHLVGERVQQGAEPSALVEPFCDEPVERV